MYTSLPRGVARCQHIKINGTRCDSPALKGKAYCYFHYRSRLEAAAGSPKANGQELTAKSQELAARSQELSPAGVPLNPELFLLEDASSIQCALQWVLRRVLAASIDRRQAALLLYGLQIASSNIKKTDFEPYYRKVIRDLPATETAEPQATESAKIAHEPAGIPQEPAQNCSDFHPESGPSQRADSTNGCHPELGRDEPISLRANGPAVSLPGEHVIPTAQPQPSAPAQLATENCQLATARPKRPSRRPAGKSLPTDHWPLTTARSALSLMFQREVKRHLARIDFPSSPDADSAES